MFKSPRIGAVIAALALVAAACGGAVEETVDTAAVIDADPSASDEPLFIDDEPTDGATPGAVSGLVVGGGLTISEALATEATGILAVQGFYVSDGTEARLCESLAESFPPQCGGQSIVVSNIDVGSLGPVSSEAGVEWTDGTVVVFGEIVDGVLEVASNVSG